MRKLLSATTALFAVAFLAGPSLASKVENSVIVIDDKGEAFTAEGVKKAEDAFHAVTFKSPTHLTVAVYKKVPDNKRSDFEAAKADKDAKNKFFKNWATELAESRNTRGVFVLVSMEGAHVRALDDRQTDARRGFTDADLKKLEEKLGDGFKKAAGVQDSTEAKKARDEGLLGGVNFVISELKNTSAPDTVDRGGAVRKQAAGGGLSTLQWVLVIGGGLLVMWIVIGLIRALTGGGGGGGGGYGGGGGGGGGFFSSLMGGMFGAMAGMYLYNSMFGGGMSSASASDSYGSDGGATDTGAGDYDGGGDGGGTDYGGGGDGAGGDWGGGGGDFGGGGDW